MTTQATPIPKRKRTEPLTHRERLLWALAWEGPDFFVMLRQSGIPNGVLKREAKLLCEQGLLEKTTGVICGWRKDGKPGFRNMRRVKYQLTKRGFEEFWLWRPDLRYCSLIERHYDAAPA